MLQDESNGPSSKQRAVTHTDAHASVQAAMDVGTVSRKRRKNNDCTRCAKEIWYLLVR